MRAGALLKSLSEFAQITETDINGLIVLSKRLRIDLTARLVATVLIAALLLLIASPVFVSAFCLAVVANETLEVVLDNKIQNKRFQTSVIYRLYLLNLAFGSSVWTSAALYLWITGSIGEMLFGLAIVLGTLTHCAFHYTESPKSLFAATFAPAPALIVMPFLLLGNDSIDVAKVWLVFLAFIILAYYFSEAAAHNLKTHRSLMTALSDVSLAKTDLEKHRDYLSHIVDQRTQELQEEKARLEQSLATERELNELQTQFVSMASHEFRTPLAIIDGSARRIAKQAAKADLDDYQDRSKTIRDAVTRMTMLIERTLDVSRIAGGHIQLAPEAFDFRALVEDVVRRQAGLAPEHTIEVNLSDCPAELDGDPKLLDNVVSNLVSNAIKYSRSNPFVEIESQTSDDEIVLRVCDHGVGIPRADLERISERFFRASNTSGIQGTGIGLNLVRSLVEQHGGTLTINSEEGKWTEVLMTLPRNQPAELMANAAPEELKNIA